MKINREDVVQAALTVQKWCREHSKGECDCPFFKNRHEGCKLVATGFRPYGWDLEEFLRTRGLRNGEV